MNHILTNLFGILSLFLVTVGSILLANVSDSILEANSKLVEIMPKVEGTLAGSDSDIKAQAERAENLTNDLKKAQQSARFWNRIGKTLFWIGIIFQLYDLVRPKHTFYF